MAEEDRFRWLKEKVVKEKREKLKEKAAKEEAVSELKLKSTSGKTYTLQIDDSSGVPQLKIGELKGISGTKELKAQ
ncbi:hypothetical protein DRN97_04380 [Methanosarcinales archaeon]|nr:MAG: hypothetical protein DRN97_04380 [Methanosarcinales archaeon]